MRDNARATGCYETYCREAVKSGLTFYELSRTKSVNITHFKATFYRDSFFLLSVNNNCPRAIMQCDQVGRSEDTKVRFVLPMNMLVCPMAFRTISENFD